jgi:hypothetical protein
MVLPTTGEVVARKEETQNSGSSSSRINDATNNTQIKINDINLIY